MVNYNMCCIGVIYIYIYTVVYCANKNQICIFLTTIYIICANGQSLGLIRALYSMADLFNRTPSQKICKYPATLQLVYNCSGVARGGQGGNAPQSQKIRGMWN